MISKEDVEHVAKLARIRLSEKETQKFQKDFSQILEYFEVLKKADTDNKEPMIQTAPQANIWREDQPRKGSEEVRKAIAEQLPEVENGFAKVKHIFS